MLPTIIFYVVAAIAVMVCLIPLAKKRKRREKRIASSIEKMTMARDWKGIKSYYLKYLKIWGTCFFIACGFLALSAYINKDYIIYFVTVALLCGYKTWAMAKIIKDLNILTRTEEECQRKDAEDEQEMSLAHSFFWDMISLIDWSAKGDDNKVIAPVVENLSKEEDSAIFLFEDILTDYLQLIDTRINYENCKRVSGYDTPEYFLNARCAAVASGRQFYENCLKYGVNGDVWNREFGSILNVPVLAWMRKHNTTHDERYPHVPYKSYLTGSNPNFERSKW